MDIGIQTWFHLHPHLRLAAFPRSPFQLRDLAQNDLCRGPDFCGAFNLLPVALLYFALPLAVKPPPLETGSFSPRPTERLGPFLRAITVLLSALICVLLIVLPLLLVFAGNLLASFFEYFWKQLLYLHLF